MTSDSKDGRRRRDDRILGMGKDVTPSSSNTSSWWWTWLGWTTQTPHSIPPTTKTSKNINNKPFKSLPPPSWIDTSIDSFKTLSTQATVTTTQFLKTIPEQVLLTTSVVIISGLGLVLRSKCTRFPTAEYILPPVMRRQPRLKGVVTSVGDSDNFRLFHLPVCQRVAWRLGLYKIPTGQELKDKTIHVRLSGIDAPESAHFGMPAQPFSSEARQWLTTRLHSRLVTIHIHRKDQYNRVVSTVYAPPLFIASIPGLRSLWPKRNVSLEMVQVGYAFIYESLGAEYGGWEKVLRDAEAKARKRRIGLWKVFDQKKKVNGKGKSLIPDVDGGIVRPDIWKKLYKGTSNNKKS